MNKREFIIKALLELKRRVFFFNISNSNVRGLADREYCYKKLKRKFRKEIKKELLNKSQYSDIVYSNKIWICWFQGIENAPVLVKKCIDSIKKNMPKHEIIILTADNYKSYIEIPEKIELKFKRGYISFAHFSDILRIELLNKYGGYWIDSTVLMTSEQNLFDEEKTPLFVFKNVSLNRKEDLAVVASSWLIYSCKENHIIDFTRRLIYSYWNKYNYLINYNVIHILFKIATEVYNEEWNEVPTFSNIPPHILQFELLNKYNQERYKKIKEMSCFHKLNRRITTNIKDSNYFMIINEGNKGEE